MLGIAVLLATGYWLLESVARIPDGSTPRS
jgi:hypothetical protein